MKNDDELLSLAKDNNIEAINILYQKYYQLLYIKALKYSKKNQFDKKDFLNEAQTTLYKAIQSYHDNGSFITYLNVCLDNHLINYCKSLNTKHNKILNNALSLNDNQIYQKEFYNEKYNPEIILLEEWNYDNLKNKIVETLTWKEELVFTLKEQNFSIKEISEITDNNLKTVYNIIKRVKEKVIIIMSN